MIAAICCCQKEAFPVSVSTTLCVTNFNNDSTYLREQFVWKQNFNQYLAMNVELEPMTLRQIVLRSAISLQKIALQLLTADSTFFKGHHNFPVSLRSYRIKFRKKAGFKLLLCFPEETIFVLNAFRV